MEIEELIEIAKKRYVEGVYINNAYSKVDPGYKSTPKFLKDNLTFNKYDPGIQIKSNGCGLGLVYANGYWADIIDKDGNIIRDFNFEEKELNTIRDWLWK